MNNAMLLTDGYKLDHRRQYPKGTQYVYSTWIPRSNKYLPEAPGAVVFGLQYLIKEYFIDYFNKNFFDRPKREVVKEFQDLLDSYLGPNSIGTQHISELHDLGYLPIRVKALPEGTICPIGVPVFTIVNTNPNFFWITNFLETIISNVIWLPMTSATSAYLYKKELVRHSKKTGFYDAANISFLCHDFSMRGMAGLEASILSGMAHMTSFNGSETIPAIEAIKKYYGCDGIIAGTVPATEHSVMCAGGYADELLTFKRLINDIYPAGFVSIVSDTWDFWKVVTSYLPILKEDIMKRNGRVVIRPDSGDPVDIICGVTNNVVHIPEGGFEDKEEAKAFYEETIIERVAEITPFAEMGPESYSMIFEYQGIYTEITLENIQWNRMDKQYYFIDMWEHAKFSYKVVDSTIYKGAYELLWETFGGTINNKGFKVLDSHIGMLYGDSITLDRQKEIYAKLEAKGFAATNLVLGIGSYTYQYKSRDTLGFAMKATWCMINNEPKEIFKKPKTDDGTKNSLKGLCTVFEDSDGVIKVKDQCTQEEEENSILETIFEDGNLCFEDNFDEIRKRLCKN